MSFLLALSLVIGLLPAVTLPALAADGLTDLRVGKILQLTGSKKVILTSYGGTTRTVRAATDLTNALNYMIQLDRGGLEVKDLTLDGEKLFNYGIYCNKAAVQVTLGKGGTLTGSKTYGVYLNIGSTFTMTGGVLSNCGSHAVYMNGASNTFEMGGTAASGAPQEVAYMWAAEPPSP